MGTEHCHKIKHGEHTTNNAESESGSVIFPTFLSVFAFCFLGFRLKVQSVPYPVFGIFLRSCLLSEIIFNKKA